jgi:Tfp pilus assembly protein PilO
MHVKIDKNIIHTVLPVLLLTAACAFAVVLISGAVLPQWKQIARNLRAERYYRANLENRQGLRALIRFYTEKQQQLQSKIVEFQGGFENIGELSEFIQIVYDAAWKENKETITFNKTLPQTESQVGAYLQCPIIFEITTDYGSLGRLVAFIERIPHIFRIDGIAISSRSATAIDATLVVTAFLKPGVGGGHD